MIAPRIKLAPWLGSEYKLNSPDLAAYVYTPSQWSIGQSAASSNLLVGGLAVKLDELGFCSVSLEKLPYTGWTVTEAELGAHVIPSLSREYITADFRLPEVPETFSATPPKALDRLKFDPSGLRYTKAQYDKMPRSMKPDQPYDNAAWLKYFELVNLKKDENCQVQIYFEAGFVKVKECPFIISIELFRR